MQYRDLRDGGLYTLAGQTFKVSAPGTTFKAQPGVYVFVRIDSEGQPEALYIGQTESLGERLGNLESHCAWSRIQADGLTVSYIFTFGLGRRSWRLAHEAALIDALEPPYNRRAG